MESGFCGKLIQGGETDVTLKDGETPLAGWLVAVVKTQAAMREVNE